MEAKRINIGRRVVFGAVVLGAVTTVGVWRLGSVLAWNGVTVGGITAVQPGPWLNPTAATPTGAWTGPPEFVTRDGAPNLTLDPTGSVGQPNGGLVYYWYVKGLKGVTAASPNTMVLVTDDWRWRTSYRRSDDTIELTATDGRRFRRKATPEYGVVAVFAPDVDTQALNPSAMLSGALRLVDGTTLSIVVDRLEWIANRATIRDSVGVDVDVAGVPKYPISTIGRRWGSSGSAAAVTDESIVTESTFEITVRGYAEDFSGRAVFVYPVSPPTADTNIKVLGGIASLRDLTVSFGSNSGITRNGFYQLTAPAGLGIEIPVPPDHPEPVAMRYAILYVPGDSVYLPEVVDNGIGGK